jgi:orotate phosphoribosyltransferase
MLGTECDLSMSDEPGQLTVTARRGSKRKLLRDLYHQGILRTWLRDRPEGWELISGLWSPFYIQIRDVASHPKLLAHLGRALARLIKEKVPEVNRLVGLAMAGIPIGTATALVAGIPLAYTRKLEGVRRPEDVSGAAASYGEHALVQGDLAEGDRIAIVDDVVAESMSKQIGLRQIQLELERRSLTDVSIECIVVVVDREQRGVGGSDVQGVPVHSLVQLKSEGVELLRGVVSERERDVIARYIDDPESFQDETVRDELRREAEDHILRTHGPGGEGR